MAWCLKAIWFWAWTLLVSKGLYVWSLQAQRTHAWVYSTVLYVHNFLPLSKDMLGWMNSWSVLNR